MALDGSTVNIGTRKSQLAIAQVDTIIAQLKMVAPGPQYQMQVVSTMADENQVKSFPDFNSKSIWTEELEQLLAEKKLDVVVHCLKGNNIPITTSTLVLIHYLHRHANVASRIMCAEHDL
jgi:porphobilinogen deaminase